MSQTHIDKTNSTNDISIYTWRHTWYTVQIMKCTELHSRKTRNRTKCNLWTWLRDTEPLSIYQEIKRLIRPKIAQSLVAVRCGYWIEQSLLYLTGVSTALLSRRLSNFRAIRWFYRQSHSASRLCETHKDDTVSYCLVIKAHVVTL